MFKKLFFVAIFMLMSLATVSAQKKEIAQAKSNIKAGKSLAEAEASMRKLLADSSNRQNDKIWLVLFDAVKKQYENVNEQMYLKQSTDTSQLFDAASRMFGVLEGLDSVDAAQAKEGKNKLKYRRKHSEYLNAYRKNLFNGGVFFMGKQDYRRSFSFFDAYIDCARQPLFSAYDYAANDRLLPKAAFYSVYTGYMAKDYQATLRHEQLARKDSAHILLTLQYVADTHLALADTASYVSTLKNGFELSPSSKYFFPHLFDYFFRNGDMKGSMDLVDVSLHADSTDAVALLAKSTVLLSLERYDECIAICNRLIAADDKIADAYLNAGLAYFNQAVKLDKKTKHSREERATMKKLYTESMPYMQRYRQLEPKRNDLWAMPLYTIYLNLNMGKEFGEMDSIVKSMANTKK